MTWRELGQEKGELSRQRKTSMRGRQTQTPTQSGRASGPSRIEGHLRQDTCVQVGCHDIWLLSLSPPHEMHAGRRRAKRHHEAEFRREGGQRCRSAIIAADSCMPTECRGEHMGGEEALPTKFITYRAGSCIHACWKPGTGFLGPLFASPPGLTTPGCPAELRLRFWTASDIKGVSGENPGPDWSS